MTAECSASLANIESTCGPVPVDAMRRQSIRAEVSEPDGSVSIDGLPAFRERVVETVFNVQDGQTMVISGLLQRSKSTSVQKVSLVAIPSGT